ncbi:MAG: SCO family protein [Gammaproteobacteria bacterium]|nr:MAG: SCO family protein [Gammaproteobacteria bacterium]
MQRYAFPCLLATLFLAFVPGTRLPAAEPQATGNPDPHAHHHHMMHMAQAAAPRITHPRYRLPKLVLRDDQDRPVDLQRLAQGPRPLIMNFIFTTCTTICPVMTSTFAGAYDRLMAAPVRPLLVSVTIDPEHDDPQVLARYRKKYHAGKDWLFLTGSPQDVRRLEQALDVYRGSKLNHEPVTLIHLPGRAAWVRMDGFTGTRRLVETYLAQLDPHAATAAH